MPDLWHHAHNSLRVAVNSGCVKPLGAHAGIALLLQTSRMMLAARGSGVIERGDTDDEDDPAVTRANSATFRSAAKVSVGRRALGLALLGVSLAGLSACGGRDRPTTELSAAQLNTIGVNAYLWRASLETVSFAPLLQADSAGGVIVTDWYANPANPGERVKLTVTILDQDLRADALRVAASRQVNEGGNWVEAPVQAATVQKLEDIILTKARDLRRQAIQS